jgi:very-short-patch-repair endonuclease
MPRQFSNIYDRPRRARALRRSVSKTGARLWPKMRGAQLGAPFRRQHPIGPWFADYCCVPLRLVVEVDGPLHDLARDACRDADLKERGYTVLRFTAHQVDEKLDAVIEAIYAEVQQRLLLRNVEKGMRADPHPASPFQGGRSFSSISFYLYPIFLKLFA